MTNIFLSDIIKLQNNKRDTKEKQNRKATTNELSEMLGVSTTTIRTDLNQMDKEKLLTKTHGGALYHDNSADNKELTGKAYSKYSGVSPRVPTITSTPIKASGITSFIFFTFEAKRAVS